MLPESVWGVGALLLRQLNDPNGDLPPAACVLLGAGGSAAWLPRKFIGGMAQGGGVPSEVIQPLHSTFDFCPEYFKKAPAS